MFEVEKLTEVFIQPLPERNAAFRPAEVNLMRFIPIPDGCEERNENLTVPEGISIPIRPLESITPSRRVVAIDGASVTLGHIDGGVVGAVRATVVVREAGGRIKAERYGPYLIVATARNSQMIYDRLRKTVIGSPANVRAPHYTRMTDRVRGFLEKFLQLEAARSYTDSLILLDGSMRVGTFDTPKGFMKRVLRHAASKGSDVAAVSKRTGLTVESTGRSILSVLDGVDGACYANVKPYITQGHARYFGNIYVCKLSRTGRVFRVDIPEGTPTGHAVILSELSGLAGDSGYPEVLRMAHVLSAFTQVEVLELQAAAVRIYGMELRENIRRELFGPFG